MVPFTVCFMAMIPVNYCYNLYSILLNVQLIIILLFVLLHWGNLSLLGNSQLRSYVNNPSDLFYSLNLIDEVFNSNLRCLGRYHFCTVIVSILELVFDGTFSLQFLQGLENLVHHLRDCVFYGIWTCPKNFDFMGYDLWGVNSAGSFDEVWH